MIGSVLFRSFPCCRLIIGDTGTVLCNISLSCSKDNPSYTMSEIENIVGECVHFALLSFYEQSGSTKNT